MENNLNFRQSFFRYSLLYQYLSVITGILVCVCCGMHAGWTSPSLPLLLQQNSTILTTNTDGSWIATAVFMGHPIGSLIGVVLVNRIGRKACLLITSLIMITSWLMIAYATNVFTIECSRFLTGVAIGLILFALPIYIAEVSNKNIRGLLGCSMQVAAKIGALLINVIGIQFDIRTTALISVSIPVLHFITFIWMPESPYFFILKKQKQKAAASLYKFTRSKNAEQEIVALSTLIVTSTTDSGKFSDIFTKTMNRRALIVIFGLRALEPLSGFLAILIYSLTIFNDAGGSISANSATIIYLSVQLVAVTVSSLLVDRFGRKPLLIISAVGSGFALLIESTYFYIKYKTDVDISNWSYVSLAAFLIFTSFYSVGLVAIPILMTGELFSSIIKAYAVGIIGIWYAVVAIVVTKLFQIVKDQYGLHVPFFAFALFCLAGAIFVIILVPETKGKTLEELQLHWTNAKIKRKKQHHELHVLTHS